MKYLKLQTSALESARGQRVALPRKRRLRISMKGILPGFLGIVTNTGLCHTGHETRRGKERYIRSLTKDVEGHLMPMTSGLLTDPREVVLRAYLTGERCLPLDEVRKAVARSKGENAAGVYTIKAGGEAMIRELYTVLTAVWQSGTIPFD